MNILKSLHCNQVGRVLNWDFFDILRRYKGQSAKDSMHKRSKVRAFTPTACDISRNVYVNKE